MGAPADSLILSQRSRIVVETFRRRGRRQMNGAKISRLDLRPTSAWESRRICLVNRGALQGSSGIRVDLWSNLCSDLRSQEPRRLSRKSRLRAGEPGTRARQSDAA